ncbi:hypothetical protein F4823DRAFT_616533 [Ustulina deusta]|nr:hypothetical protein F4823DRAFT_616533 [Ustulina deusta]
MSTHVTSNRIPEVNWEKLAAKAGFKDGATAKAHYEPLLNTDRPGDAAKKRQNLYDTEAAPECIKTELSDIKSTIKSERVKTDTYYCSSDLEDGEV